MAADWARLRSLRCALLAGAALLLAGCASGTADAPPQAQHAWAPPPTPADWRTLAEQGPTAAANNALAPTVAPQADQRYDLPALIDLAQRNNMATRVAWNQARQAASAVGLTEATFLPMISARAVAGRMKTRHELPRILGERPEVDTSLSGTVPMLTLEWLLFDFGQRAAANQAAHNLSLGANFLFNAVHQKLVFDVTRTYYEYGAARQGRQISDETLANSLAVQDAVLAKRKAGLATSVEEAQVRQLVAQARLRLVRSTGAERNAYQALLDHLGLAPGTVVRIAASDAAPLPSSQDLPEGAVLRRALAERPDIMASIASLKAAESGVDLARADFLPKVFLAGFLVGGHNDLSIGPVSGLSNNAVTRGVLLGVSLPLYDGGMRSSRLRDAHDRVHAAQASLERLRNTAMTEIILASNTLETALQAHEAAETLVQTAAVTYDAALDAYRVGMGTVTVATEAANGLLTARTARADARAAAQIAAATLALSLGRLDAGPPASAR